MKEYFDRHIVMQAELYAKEKYPEEMCGFILEDRFQPLTNIAVNKVNNFRVSENDYLQYRNEIKAVVHSHADYPHIGKTDMEGQIRSEVPWGVILLKCGAVEHIAFWGDKLPVQDLIGRPFIHGIYDCYALVRDYWRHKGFDVVDFPRENLWWEKEPSMLEDLCVEAGFDFIDETELRIGDVIFAKVLAPVANHSGIYIGDGLMLHHLYNKLSRREPLHRWKKHVTGYLRYRYA